MSQYSNQAKHMKYLELVKEFAGRNLYEQILQLTSRVAHSEEWIEQIPNMITSWQKSILVRQ